MSVFDEVGVKLNPTKTRAEQLGMRFGRPRIPDRPADDADQAEWITYLVALGAERGALEESGMTADQLIALADRLGG